MKIANNDKSDLDGENEYVGISMHMTCLKLVCAEDSQAQTSEC